MYVNKNVREITNDTVPLPTKSYAEFSGNGIKDKLDDTKDFNATNYFRNAWQEGFVGDNTKLTADAAAFWSFGIDLSEKDTTTSLQNAPQGMLEKFAPTFLAPKISAPQNSKTDTGTLIILTWFLPKWT